MADRRRKIESALDIDPRGTLDRRRDLGGRQELEALYLQIYLKCLASNRTDEISTEEITFSDHTETAAAISAIDRLTNVKRSLAEFAQAMMRQGYRCEQADGRQVSLRKLERWFKAS